MNSSRPSSAPSAAALPNAFLIRLEFASFLYNSAACLAIVFLRRALVVSSFALKATLGTLFMAFLNCLKDAPLATMFSKPPAPKAENPEVITPVKVPLAKAAPKALSCFSS